jgi:hypothetical protein
VALLRGPFQGWRSAGGKEREGGAETDSEKERERERGRERTIHRYVYRCTYMYIYIYIERERWQVQERKGKERERGGERAPGSDVRAAYSADATECSLRNHLQNHQR